MNKDEIGGEKSVLEGFPLKSAPTAKFRPIGIKASINSAV